MSQTLKATFLFLYVLLSSAFIIGIVRHISADFHTFQIVLFYNVFATLCFVPWLAKRGFKLPKTSAWKLYSLRAVMEFVSFSLSFYALTFIPMPMHTALLFMMPIFGTLLAVSVLNERPTIYSIICIAAGFTGVLIITRPGLHEFSPGIIYALLAAFGFAVCGNVIKLLTRTESSDAIALYMLIMTTVIASAAIGLLIMLDVVSWTSPTLTQWGWLAAIGVFGYSQQIAIAAALQRVPYTTIIPLNFAQLVFVSIIAYVVYNEIIDGWTIVGAVIIIAGTLYNAYMSSKRPTVMAVGLDAMPSPAGEPK